MNRPDASRRLRKLAMELNKLADDLDRLPLSESMTARIRVFSVTHPTYTPVRLAKRFSVTVGQVKHALLPASGPDQSGTS